LGLVVNVDWVERVMKTLVGMSRETPAEAFSVGIFVPNLVERLGLARPDDHLLAA
jgi:hypothetical protein